MDTDHKLLLYKYCASNINIIEECGENLFKIQKHYVENGDKNSITFCPIHFFASNIRDILNLEKTMITSTKFPCKIPQEIINEDLILFVYNANMNNLHITQLYIRNYKKFKSNDFNSKAYYSIYYKEIEGKYKNSKLSREEKAALFYVEYGYWHKLELKFVHPLQYICSYPQYKDMDFDDCLKQYHTNYDNILFDPYIYVASNINDLHFLIEKDEFSYNTEVRIFKYFIRNGINKKHEINSFNKYEYLSNNIKSLKNILKEGQLIYWNKQQLITRDVAIHYIREFKANKIKKDIFNRGKFIKQFINDPNVNYDKKLSLENAHVYFVDSYIRSHYVRYTTSFRYKTSRFFNERIKDSLRTLPLQMSKYIVNIPTI